MTKLPEADEGSTPSVIDNEHKKQSQASFMESAVSKTEFLSNAVTHTCVFCTGTDALLRHHSIKPDRRHAVLARLSEALHSTGMTAQSVSTVVCTCLDV